ncbi:efflux transporter outer membrane subunit [Dokdonella fugitiva]|jgi:NodT family efflux transporter outer membrane factor (OMF) lipoprotein|uniref:NodT family efflux transporter outer membrane factor (OMF) lipoprotein n=1 Tax=Dokdonella fugitiva TaxID=328517 RepID=A0A4R2I071_9GAMM|nr:efflux transporter outer membrane subunit [Dokdonella fugitiva]MBA8884550.1 NodT family efflux transporter outer membrane factor (OMF) lipoprotein [Dokdonella fugitiva]TCO37262.1 NodT family efflux transporter outer membrane factor (OMF) lipoprotein [Dokdonella fugitiva]
MADPILSTAPKALALGLMLALGACTVGPDYVKPDAAAPAEFARADAATDAAAVPAPDDAFWARFGDAELTALIEQALAANNDLKVALAHYERANAELRSAKFDALPVITASANGQDIRASADQLPGVDRDGRDTKSYDAGVAASWELDLFGRIRRSIEAGRADAAASAADLAAAQVAIAGSVARTYVELRGLQERLRVAQDNATNQRETLQLVDARVNAGGGTDFDSARARAQLETTDARVPALEAQIAFAMHRLAVLTGRTPGALIEELQTPGALPALPERLDAGTPGELLRRRPDVAAAEQRLHAATARIGVATADLFPRFTLGGLLGTQAISTGSLFERDSETHLLALGVDWSFLDVGHVRARIAASGADAEAALAQYRQSVLLALEDTENALVRYAKARAEDAQLERAATDSAEAARLARVRYEAGAAGLLEVLDAERSRLQAQDAFADARTRSVTGAVALYQALAGGWPQHVPQREGIAQR